MLRGRKQSVLVSKRYKEKKRKKQTWKIILGVCAGMLLIGAGISFFYVPQLQIQRVKVDVSSYETHISPIITDEISKKIYEQVMNRLSTPRWYVLPGSHVFFNLPSHIEREVEYIDPRVVSFNISKEKNEIRIAPEIRIPYGLWCGDTGCVSIDTTGVVIGSDIDVAPVQRNTVSDLSFKDQSEFIFYRDGDSDRQPVPGNVYVQSDIFNASTLFAERLRQEDFVVNTFTINTYGEDQIASATLQNDKGQKLFIKLASSDEDYAQTLKYFRLFKAQIRKEGIPFDAFEYVDLRFGNAVYFKQYEKFLDNAS